MAVGPVKRRNSEWHADAPPCLRATKATLTYYIAVLVLVFGLTSLPAVAQSTAGRVLGSITDQSGAAVAGTTVIVTNVQRGTSRTITTDASRDYVAADLAPGTYKIHAEARGFKTVKRPSVTVDFAAASHSFVSATTFALVLLS
jgi:hypothetical protein